MSDETMARIASLEAAVKQLGRDLDFALQSIALLNSRYATLDERHRRMELEKSRGVR